jgi:hypothetical protein
LTYWQGLREINRSDLPIFATVKAVSKILKA